MIRYLTKQFGMMALGLCILATSIEVRGVIHDHDRPYLQTIAVMRQELADRRVHDQQINYLAGVLPAKVLRSH